MPTRPEAPPAPLQKVRNAFRLGRAVRMIAGAAPRLFAGQALLVAFQGLLPLAALLLARQVVDAVVAGDFPRSLTWLAAAAGLAVVVAISNAAGSVLSEALTETVRDHVAGRLHRQSTAVDLGYYEDPTFHDTLHRAQREGTWRVPRLATGLSQLGRDVTGLLAMAALLATLRWWLAGLLLVAALPGVLGRLRYSHRLFGFHERAAGAERAATYHDWLLTGAQWAAEIRLLGIGPYLARRYGEIRTGLRTERLALVARRAGADAFAQAAAALVLFVTFALLARQATSGALTVGAFVMYFAAVQRGLASLQGVLSSLSGLYEDNLFLRHLDEFLDLEPRVVDPASPRPFPKPFTRGIRFENVTFRYRRSDRPVLDGVSFEIPAGSLVALVGLNGSGKSTLVKLLLRLYDPERGSISVDGVDLREMSGAEVRRNVSALLQDFGRFAFTARENVRLSDADAPPDDERLREAARLSGALAEVEALPRGWESVLGSWFDDGRDLSAGQWQKLALARSLFRDAPLLVLDEPSASLDAIAERDFVDRLVNAARGRTTLLVSHRFSSVRSAHRIAVLDGGRLVELGSHDELARAGGLYARMFSAQADPYR